MQTANRVDLQKCVEISQCRGPQFSFQ